MLHLSPISDPYKAHWSAVTKAFSMVALHRPFELNVEDLLCFGTEEGRGLDLTVVAKSKVHFSVPNNTLFDKALSDLRTFATTLRLRRANDVHYGWGKLYANRSLRVFQFEVIWYNQEFYRNRHNGYRSTLHQRILSEFGISPDDLIVEHQSVQIPDRRTTLTKTL